MHTGSCFCGAVRFEVKGEPWDETLCHCSICRRTSGAPSVAWASFPRAGFRFAFGTPVRTRSSPAATRSFCGGCGTPLVFEHDRWPEEIDITICSLDHPEAIRPKDHTHVGSRLSWDRPGDGLPEYRGARTES